MATFILATWKLTPKTKSIGWKQEISAENTAWIWFLLKPHQKMISSKNSSKEVRHQKPTYVPKILKYVIYGQNAHSNVEEFNCYRLLKNTSHQIHKVEKTLEGSLDSILKYNSNYGWESMLEV